MGMTPLGDLIEECRRRFVDQHGVELSYSDIANRGGKVITRGRVQQLAKDPIKAMPSAATLQALATGLGVNEALVVERALASTGYGDWGLAARRGTPQLDTRRAELDRRAEHPDPPAPDDPA
jgi:transcriptional regulator with XRE-family HTH domain